MNYWEKKESERKELEKKKEEMSREKMLKIRRDEVEAFENLRVSGIEKDSREMKIWVEKTKKWDEAMSLKPAIAQAVIEQVYRERFDNLLKKVGEEVLV